MKKEVKIGLFGLLTIFLLYWGISFLKGRDLFRLNNTHYAFYENVSGIQVSSPIMIRGINIGSVTRITFRPDLGNLVELQLSIKGSYQIPDNSVARIASTGIIGGKAIEIELGDSPTFLKDNSAIEAETETSLLDIAGSEFDYFKQQIGELIKNLDTVLEGVSAAIGEDGKNLTGTLANIESITGQLDNAIKGKADALGEAIDNINTFSSTLAANSGRIDSMMANLDQFSGTLAETDIAATVDKLNTAADLLNETLSSTDGSLGLLLNDPSLYKSLEEASQNLSSLLADLEENPNRYVHFSLFGRRNR